MDHIAAPPDTIEGRRTIVEVDGHPIHLLEGGAGRPLLFLHAAGGAEAWNPVLSALARRFRVIAPDHPGFDRTPEIESVEGVDDLAHLYSSLIDVLDLGDVAIVGMSFGGWIAAELALLDRQRVTQLVLINAIGLRLPGAPIADMFAMSPPQKGAALFHDSAIAEALFAGEPDIDTIMAFWRNERAFARYAWQPFCCDPKLSGRLHRIRARTLVLLGAEDKVVPRAHGARYAEAIPNATLEMMPAVGHANLMEKPEESVAAILRFLRD